MLPTLGQFGPVGPIGPIGPNVSNVFQHQHHQQVPRGHVAVGVGGVYNPHQHPQQFQVPPTLIPELEYEQEMQSQLQVPEFDAPSGQHFDYIRHEYWRLSQVHLQLFTWQQQLQEWENNLRYRSQHAQQTWRHPGFQSHQGQQRQEFQESSLQSQQQSQQPYSQPLQSIQSIQPQPHQQDSAFPPQQSVQGSPTPQTFPHSQTFQHSQKHHPQPHASYQHPRQLTVRGRRGGGGGHGGRRNQRGPGDYRSYEDYPPLKTEPVKPTVDTATHPQVTQEPKDTKETKEPKDTKDVKDTTKEPVPPTVEKQLSEPKTYAQVISKASSKDDTVPEQKQPNPKPSLIIKKKSEK